MLPLDVIEQISTASSRIAKERIIIDAYANNCFEFFEAVRLAADPFITFGVKKVAKIMEDDGAVGTFTFADFRALCDRLYARTLTGEAARIALHEAAERCNVPTWNLLYRRVLLKDLSIDQEIFDHVLTRLGADALRYRIPVFRCQMATSSAKPQSGQRLLDVKLDGTRVLAVLGASVGLYTMDGAIMPCPELEQALHSLASHTPAPIVLDGVKIQTGEYVLFDLIPLADFRDRCCVKPQRDRRTMLELLQRSGVFAETRLVRVLPQVEVDFQTSEGQSAFIEFGRQAIEHGHSAIVIKKPDAPYVGKRTTAWIKYKCPITSG